MKVIIIDGQGGKLGAMLTQAVRTCEAQCDIYAIGTNSAATSAMMKAGADFGATGENPVTVACRDADVIMGPVGILAADSLLGEITPITAREIGAARAVKILIPLNKCNIRIAGTQEKTMSELIRDAVAELVRLTKQET